ncbi:disease resistance protein PIK6-NP [Setaria viridis]|uniref:disease resistance protein PIK6-NP n=1 Tax=Setaria viridis TaxID=4556 RepID=UPI003B3A94C9
MVMYVAVRVHDMVLDLIRYLSYKENFVTISNDDEGTSPHQNRVRRLAHQNRTMKQTQQDDHMDMAQVRTLVACDCDIQSWVLHPSFKLMRVLHLEGCRPPRRDWHGLKNLGILLHLRYLGLQNSSKAPWKFTYYELPKEIGKLKFLQILDLEASSIRVLPSSVCQLTQLVCLRGCRDTCAPDGSFLRTVISLEYLRIRIDNLDEESQRQIIKDVSNQSEIRVLCMTNESEIPKEFGGLRNLRTLYGFRVHMDMDGGWCSLEEIGPLSKLWRLTLHGLENVSASSFAETARISSKEHPEYLKLQWSRSGCMELRDEIQKQQQQVAEEVLEKLCPPPHIHHLNIKGYFGRTLPNWMMVVEAFSFTSLIILKLKDLPCCTKLPDSLCPLPSLKLLVIKDAPAIKSVGSEFQASTSAAFPNLTHLTLEGLCEWEEWDWEEQTVDVTAGTMAMHALGYLLIENCKLSCFPPGLANNKRHALRELGLRDLNNLTSVENFPSVVELDVFDCPKLKRISGLSRLHKIRIARCPKLEVLQGVPSLDSLLLHDTTMETLPGYLACVNPRFLRLTCSKELHDSIISGSSSECEKINHITKHDIDYN